KTHLVSGKIEKGRWYRVRVEARGSRFRMFLDGKLLTSGYHDGLPRGCVGLVTNDSSARFRNVKVTDPDGKVLLDGVLNPLPKAKDVADRDVGAALQEAVSLKPADAEARFALGSFHAQWGEWKKAAAEFDRGLELDPVQTYRWMEAAVVHLAAGDLEGYRLVCREMFQRFGDSEDPVTADRTARACLLLPDAVSPADYDRVQKLAERAVTGTEKHVWYLFFVQTKALADYRAGRYAEAVKCLEKYAPKANGNPEDASMFAIQSMALHRLGRTEEAGAALAKAKALVNNTDPAPGRPWGRDWLVPVIAWHECRMAD